MFKRILVPTDGSELSTRAVKQAVAFAKEHGAEVVGFYAAPDYHMSVYEDFVPPDFVSPEQFKANTKRVAEQRLSTIVKAAEKAGVPCETLYSTSDKPHEAIIEAARKRKCDLIFMASHGRRGIAGMLLGSETQKVLTYSKIPVLVTR
jgi:nucleotide-binding universal stress UspA family protein